MMYQGEAPSAWAARTNSFSRNDFYLRPHAEGRHSTQPKSAAMRMMVTVAAAGSAPPAACAASSGGTTENTSMMRMMNQSIAAAEIAGQRPERDAHDEAEQSPR